MKNSTPRKSALSASQRRLLNLMQDINFGRIERLRIRSGQPSFDPPPRILHDVKIGAQNGPRGERELPDFALRREVVELFEQLSRVDSGVVHTLQIRHGLPFSFALEAEDDLDHDLARTQSPSRPA